MDNSPQRGQSFSQKYSFEEFKMYYKTTEITSERKVRNNEINLSLSTAILIAIAVSWSWALTNAQFSFVVYLFTAVLSILAMLFCSLWIEQIKKATFLNNAKFEVLSEMAPYIQFNDPDIASYRPFDKEWDKLIASRAVEANAERVMKTNTKRPRIKGKNVIVFRSTQLEEFIPAAFRAIYGLSGIASIIAVATQWQNIYHGVVQIIANL